MPTSVYSPHSRVTQIEFTRSCPFNCCFCATTQFRGRYQKRGVADCLNEVSFLKDHFNIEELDVIDSNLIVDKKWTKELLVGLKEIGISWANPGGLWVGGLVECGSNILVGTKYENIVGAFEAVLTRSGHWIPPADYLVEDVSDIVINMLLGRV